MLGSLAHVLLKTMYSTMQQKIQQYLVHSFLYYRLDESLIEDQDYDQLCQELKDWLDSTQGIMESPFQNIVARSLAEEASGFSIRKYPAEIISTALHLLYQQRYKPKMSFNHFLDRLGYRLA